MKTRRALLLVVLLLLPTLALAQNFHTVPRST